MAMTSFVPTMTANTVGNFTVIRSGDYSVSYPARHAFDGDDGSRFLAAGSAANQYVGINFTGIGKYRLTGFAFLPQDVQGQFKAPFAVEVYTGSAWEIAMTYTATNYSASTINEVTLSNQLAGTGFRIRSIEPSYLDLKTLKFAGLYMAYDIDYLCQTDNGDIYKITGTSWEKIGNGTVQLNHFNGNNLTIPTALQIKALKELTGTSTVALLLGKHNGSAVSTVTKELLKVNASDAFSTVSLTQAEISTLTALELV